MHNTPLISTLVFGLGAAFIFGAIAQRIRVSPLVGYLIAGIVVGPSTPGLAADPEIAAELAEIGVILLMFGVGLHFSIQELLSVRRIAIPGAIGQIALATLMGTALGWALGWSIEASLLFGLALSVASTVVLMRALQERRLVDSVEGRIAVGWLIVEDLAMVLALVLIPALAGVEPPDATLSEHPEALEPIAGGQSLWLVLTITIGKVAAFVAVMLVVGRRAIPWIMHYVAHTGSRELFRLAVLAIALGIAFGAAALFDVSLALGAFFAGMILSESPLSQRAAEESLPFRDAFAVLFFVSVGMIFEPAIILEAPLAVLGTAVVIIFGKSVAAYFIVRAFGHPVRVALTISASLAQVGEFSFILAGLGVSLAILPEEGRDLVLAGAIISILLNPVLFAVLDRWKTAHEPAEGAEAAALPAADLPAKVALANHAVVVGYGRVGSFAGDALIAEGVPIVVVEDNPRIVSDLKARNVAVIPGNGVLDDVMEAANLAEAQWLLVAIPEPFEASRIVRRGRDLNPALTIIARAHFDAEVAHLRELGADYVIMGEREIAKGMVEHVRDGGRIEAARADAAGVPAAGGEPSGAAA